SNVYTGELAFPRLSREAIIFLNPDVIIDSIPAAENLDAVRRDWQSLASVSAIKNQRLYLFTDEADTVPGPRFYQTLTKLSHALYPQSHPEPVE
ncbi:MAG: ABC transporter substrate-binding protein, partial [Deltaproteobacteria bacterium]|nr:ABC transporter substrate-binding protein [Deltaproteobacteria bacterium]